MSCPFCNLQSEKTRTIKSGKLTTIILSNPRLMPGHTLVVPNRHVEKPWELADDELVAIFSDIKWVESVLLKTIATGCDIRQNYRPFLPQGRTKVDHVHFHVLPRTSEDQLYQTSMKYETQLFKDLSEQEETSIQKLFSTG